MPDLEELRDRIDKVDEELVKLLSERARLAAEVGALKGDADVYVPAREKAVYEHIKKLNKGPLPASLLNAIFREIMSATKALQKKTVVAHFGPPGTFTHLAALKRFGHSVEYVGMADIRDLFAEVEQGRADYAVVPVENSTEGGVNQALDMFLESTLRICNEIYLPVHQHLMAADEGLTLKDIKTVYSHPQALAQCRKFLAESLPHAELHETPSTVEAALKAKEEPGSAALASEAAAELHDLSIIRRSVEDSTNNITRFFVLSRQESPSTGNDKTSVLVSIKDEVGALLHLLEPFYASGLNLTRIESRPSKRRAWDYVFFMDFEGHAASERVRKVLDDVKQHCSYLEVLGSYPKAEPAPAE